MAAGFETLRYNANEIQEWGRVKEEVGVPSWDPIKECSLRYVEFKW